MRIVKGRTVRPRRVLLYGTHGIGKSTWAASAPTPLFLQVEDGLDDIGTDRTELLKSMGDVSNAISWLGNNDHRYKSIVIDTLDWLERLVFQATCEKHMKSSIEDFAYGKGYTHALDGWAWLLKSLDHLRKTKQVNIVMLAHAKVVRHEPPDGDSYDRYEPDLHKKVAPMLQEWTDEVFFAGYQVDTIKQDEGFNRERSRAIGDGNRVVYTTEMPTHLAKRRIAMPDRIPLDWAEYQKYWPKGNNVAGDVAGVVVDGSSKKKVTNNG